MTACVWIAAGMNLAPTSTIRGIPTAFSRRPAEVRAEFERILSDYVSDAYRAHLAGRDAPRSFLEADRLSWERWRENALHLPRSVFDAYSYYLTNVNDRDLGSVRVYRTRCLGRRVFAIRVTTDGDSGWLELYDESGLLLGAARTYLELVAWDRLESVRGQVESMELPPALRDAPRRTLWGKPPGD